MDPAIALFDGVITGTNNGQTLVNGNPLSYTVVGAPSAGWQGSPQLGYRWLQFLARPLGGEFRRRHRDVHRIGQRDDAADCRINTGPIGGGPGAAP